MHGGFERRQPALPVDSNFCREQFLGENQNIGYKLFMKAPDQESPSASAPLFAQMSFGRRSALQRKRKNRADRL
jgi:hypothetical protein